MSQLRAAVVVAVLLAGSGVVMGQSPAPTIFGVSPFFPSSSPAGQVITISGLGFLPGATVVFAPPNGAAVTASGAAIQSLTNSSIQATIVLGITGNWSVKVVNPDGQASNGWLFTVQAPFPVAQPIATPGGGSYVGAQSIVLTTPTTGATIRYTIDGTEPTAASPVYSTPILVSTTATIKARASKSGMPDSSVLTASYAITPQVAAPVAAPGTGTYVAAQIVTLTSPTTGATIRYTTNGSAPTASSAVYTTPIAIAATTTLKAQASETGMTSSPVATFTYTIMPLVAMPTATPAPGTYQTPQSVTLATTTRGATIRYTTDGSAPTVSSPVYSGPIPVSATTTITAQAFESGMTNSGVLTAAYAIVLLPVATPMASPNWAAGYFITPPAVTLTTATPGATIRYTTDGSTPSASSPIFTGPITVSITTTIAAQAFKTGMTNSPVATFTYTIAPRVATPTANPASGTYTTPQNVTLATATAGATIRYTTDGSAPAASSPIYSGPILVSATTTIQAQAFEAGRTNSGVLTATYTIALRVAAPTASPDGDVRIGTLYPPQSVTLTTTTPGATIRYTTDGSAPTPSSQIYAGPIALPSGTTAIYATAFKSGLTQSPTAGPFIYLLSAATPTASPAGGTYATPQTVTLSTTTSGATIRYATNGTYPTSTSTVYTGPLTISVTTTIYATAYKSGLIESPSAGPFAYTIVPQRVATPTANPAGGTYQTLQTVTLSSATPGATIRYTTDGSAPTASSRTYSAPIVMSGPTFNPTTSASITTTVKAQAFKSGMTDSGVMTAGYTIAPYVAMPTANPPAGAYQVPQKVTLATATPGATISYTTQLSGQAGGSVPSAMTPYTGPITVSATTLIEARAYKPPMFESQTLTALYTIAMPVATPSANPTGGTYQAPQSVTLATATPGATIRYTTDGSAPTASSTVYGGPIAVSSTTTIKAQAVQSGMTDSGVMTAAYTIALQKVATPTASPGMGNYSTVQQVTLSTATPGATIRYTTDTSYPTSTSPVYTGPITVSKTTTIYATAFKTGMSDSVAAGPFTYTIAPGTVATPTANPTAGTYQTPQTVTLSTTTPGATIRYTTNSSYPTASSPAYSGPIAVSSTTTFYVTAYRAGMTESVSAGPFTYTIAPQVVAAPTASPSGATGYDGASGIDVTLGTTTSGATIRYTTNDTYTTASSPVYASPIKLGQASSNVIYAQAFRDGMLPSPIAGPFRYTRGPQIAQVTLTTTDRTNPAGPLVTPSCPTPGVAMEYTFLDRATQTWSPRPMPYTGAAIRVPPGKMLYVRAYAQGMSSFWASIGF